MPENTTGYTRPAKVFHWLTVLGVICAISLGLLMMNLEGPLQSRLFDLHRSFGALVLGLTALRLGWRVFHKPPPLPAGLPAWQHQVSQLVHWALYGLLFITPLLGWAGTSAYRAPISVFGLFFLPPIVDENRALSEKLLGLHGLAMLALSALITMHVGAALFHHFVRKDGVLARMWPWRI